MMIKLRKMNIKKYKLKIRKTLLALYFFIYSFILIVSLWEHILKIFMLKLEMILIFFFII